MSTDDHLVELRGEVPRELVDVMDAVAQATPGGNRMSVLRDILKEWVEREKHRAMLVTRVTRGNGSESEPERNRSGSRSR